MKVAIDRGPLFGGHAIRGIGVHTHEIINELKKLKDNNVEISALDFSEADLSKFDVVHYPYFHPYFITLPFQKPAKKLVLTIHDLIPLIYPNHYPPGLKGKVRFEIQKHLLRNVDAVITISETSKKDICRLLPLQPDKVDVVYLAPRKIFKKITDEHALNRIKLKYSLPDKFVLYVGDVNYNKNILTLIKACKIAKFSLVICGKQALDIEELGQGLALLRGPMDYARFLAGKPHPELAHFKELLEEFKANKSVIRLGFVPDNDLVAIYNLATVYCQPSFYEGFGLPVLEALASGTPVIASKTQALVEIARDTVLFANPKNPKEFADQIKKIATNSGLEKSLINRGNERVKMFSWEKTATETLKVYKTVCY